MPCPLEDYALIGDCYTAALVNKAGSIDWLCLPRFDSPSCFSRLLGGDENGYFCIAPLSDFQTVRRYLKDTLILESEFSTKGGRVLLRDFMTPRTSHPDVVRIVEGLEGEVEMSLCLRPVFDYGGQLPWLVEYPDHVVAIAGPDAVSLHSKVKLHIAANASVVAKFRVKKGERVSFVMAWSRSYERASFASLLDAQRAFKETKKWWEDWSTKGRKFAKWHDDVSVSLRVLKAMTYAPTGGMVAAVTTSLPEQLGGVRNWDYRYCWVRDSTFVLYALMSAGYKQEAKAWREWLLRAVAGSPAQMQIMYGLAGERRLEEREIPWLSGYENSRPVRVGNAAYKQFQLDVYGEVMDSFHVARKLGLKRAQSGWNVQRALLEFLEGHWNDADDGIWEVRGPRRHFTFSKVMAWVAFDRAVKAFERFRLEGPVDRWRLLRERVHVEICEKGYNRELQSFVQFYESSELDASLLILPLVGFLPPSDPRIKSTLAAIQKSLCKDMFVWRYQTHPDIDGLLPGEGAFIACSFWLVDNLVLQGRMQEAEAMFEKLLKLRNDVGLLSEEYDVSLKRMTGNFPQAFSHVSLINSAANLTRAHSPAQDRTHT